MEYLGRDGAKALFVTEKFGVVVDEASNEVIEVADRASLTASAEWDVFGEDPNGPASELANAALTSLDITVLGSNDRLYTIPDAVIAEAKRGLEWRKEENRGGTPVGLNTARTLARGGQVGLRKVRHIAKYFPRHEVDKKGKGYKPAQDNYPSNGRIAWALWGGDAAQRWASAIVERENKKDSVTAGLYPAVYGTENRVDFDSFSSMGEFEPDFYIRIRLDGSGVDRLYMVDEAGDCKFWDDGAWEDLGNVEHDFDTYDKALDDAYDKVQKIHTPCDRESAIKISAMLDNAPLENIEIQKINFDESELFEQAIPGLDWNFIDQLSEDSAPEEDEWDVDGLMAAAESGSESVTLPSTVSGDTTPGVYTEEERAANAETQVRDKLGRFAVNGSRVVIGGDYAKQGIITAQNPATGGVTVQLDNGNSVEVAGNLTQEISTFEPVSQSNFPANNLDFSGILGEPRTPVDEPQAQLPGTLPPLTGGDVSLMLNDWSTWVGSQRLAAEAGPLNIVDDFVPKAVPSYATAMNEYYTAGRNADGTRKDGWNPALAPNLYNDPLLRNWIDSKSSSGENVVAGWYKDTKGVEAKKSSKEVNSPANAAKWDKDFAPENPLRNQPKSVRAAGEAQVLTPENTDVPPIYMAIVTEDDPAAVMELVALLPKNSISSEPTTFVRRNQKWERNDKIASDLKSPTPPPVVVLSNEDLSEVVKQIDGGVVVASLRVPMYAALSKNYMLASIQAAGGADRNRGNAEKLRRYWTKGEGGMKIAWGTPGDWTRCTKFLSKYMGNRSKGYCALRHKEMNGMWPGDKRNPGMRKKSIRASIDVATLRTEEEVIGEFTLHARAEAARSRMIGREGVVPAEHGAKFTIPLVIPEGMETGDGRIFEAGAISMRDLPLPLLWQIKTGQGHDGSVVVGQITSMERTSQGIGNAYGVFDLGEYGKEAERLVRNGFIRGVSADMDKFEADEEEPEDASSDDTTKIESGRINIKNARVMAVTIVPKPAFQECFIQIIEEDTETQEDEVAVPDGVYVDGVNPLDASALVACGMVAGAIPLEPPTQWFENQKLAKATPLTITDEGQVFGHIAAWHVDHIGMAFGTRPPKSRSKYAYFHTGVVRTQEGKDMPVGQLTLAGGHAGLEASASEAVRHYDDTASAFADVHAGEDAYGIWVAGSLRPGTTPEAIRAARASAPSGDWRPIKGALELVAVCQVNVPGFPIARARVASGQVMALVAAGANVLAQLKSDPLAELSAKINNLEMAHKAPMLAAAEEARSKFAALNTEILKNRQAELAARVAKAKEEDSEYMDQMMDDDTKDFAVVSRRVRERLAKEGKALPDLSYPIRNENDLRNAIQAYGRAKPGHKGVVRKHIMKQARALDRKDLIPETWKVASSEFTIDDMALDLRERIEFAAKSTNSEALFEKDVLTAAGVDEVIEDLTPDEIEALKQEAKSSAKKVDTEAKYTPETQPRDERGKFRQVLARLKQDLGTSGLQDVVEKVKEAENLDSAGNYESAAKAAGDLIGIIDRLDAKALNPDSLENIRTSSAELGKVISNLPFAFGQEAEKIRFSDIPPALQDLMKDMIKKVEDKIGEEDAAVATEELKGFMSGADYYNQSEISSQMAKLLRLLT